MNPLHNLLLAQPRHDDALHGLAAGLADEGLRLPGVTAAVPEVDLFASVWQGLTGAASRVRMAQHIYQATAAIPVEGVGDHMRRATRQDRSLVFDWMARFGEETGAWERIRDERIIDQRLGAGGFVLWEDGEPVSLAGARGRTPNGVGISHVYTPPASGGMATPARSLPASRPGCSAKVAASASSTPMPLHRCRYTDAATLMLPIPRRTGSTGPWATSGSATRSTTCSIHRRGVEGQRMAEGGRSARIGPVGSDRAA